MLLQSDHACEFQHTDKTLINTRLLLSTSIVLLARKKTLINKQSLAKIEMQLTHLYMLQQRILCLQLFMTDLALYWVFRIFRMNHRHMILQGTSCGKSARTNATSEGKSHGSWLLVQINVLHQLFLQRLRKAIHLKIEQN